MAGKHNINGLHELEMLKSLLKHGYNKEYILVLICEALMQYYNGGKLTNMEQFLVGLRIAQIFAPSESPEALTLAEIKRNNYLTQLGITQSELLSFCKQVGIK